MSLRRRDTLPWSHTNICWVAEHEILLICTCIFIFDTIGLIQFGNVSVASCFSTLYSPACACRVTGHSMRMCRYTIRGIPATTSWLAGMVAYMDDTVGEIVSALVARQMWDETLFVFVSDNGGAVRE